MEIPTQSKQQKGKNNWDTRRIRPDIYTAQNKFSKWGGVFKNFNIKSKRIQLKYYLLKSANKGITKKVRKRQILQKAVGSKFQHEFSDWRTNNSLRWTRKNIFSWVIIIRRKRNKRHYRSAYQFKCIIWTFINVLKWIIEARWILFKKIYA